MNTIIEKIRAEVERRKKELEKDKTIHPANQAGRIKELDLILSRLSNLEKECEKPMEHKDIDTEIGHWLDRLDDKYCLLVPHYSIEDIKDTARHFAQWGAEHLASAGKMIEPEKKEGRTDCSPQGEVPNGNLATQSYENIPNDLEEAAKAYADYINSNEVLYTYTDFPDAFKAGAKWQKEKDKVKNTEIARRAINGYKEEMLKEAVEGTLYEYRGILMAKIYVPHPEQFKPEDVNVKVLIIKED